VNNLLIVYFKMDDNMNLSKNLRRLLDEQQLSVAQLSRRTGVPAKTLYHWLSGQQPQKIEHLFRICDTLKVSIEELYGRKKKITASAPREWSELIPLEGCHLGAYEVILRPLKTVADE
jgi:transcriptional regulator with XRE-family HTH domain